MNLAKTLSEHLYQVTSNRRYPLPYGMMLSRFLRTAGVDLSSEVGIPVSKSDEFGEASFQKMGFKRTKPPKRARTEGNIRQGKETEMPSADEVALLVNLSGKLEAKAAMAVGEMEEDTREDAQDTSHIAGTAGAVSGQETQERVTPFEVHAEPAAAGERDTAVEDPQKESDLEPIRHSPPAAQDFEPHAGLGATQDNSPDPETSEAGPMGREQSQFAAGENIEVRLASIEAALSTLQAKTESFMGSVCARVEALTSIVEAIIGPSKPDNQGSSPRRQSSPSTHGPEPSRPSPMTSNHSPEATSPAPSATTSASSDVVGAFSPRAASSASDSSTSGSNIPISVLLKKMKSPRKKVPGSDGRLSFTLQKLRGHDPAQTATSGPTPSLAGQFPKRFTPESSIPPPRDVVLTELSMYSTSEKSYRIPPMSVVTCRHSPDIFRPPPRLLRRPLQATAEEIEHRKKIDRRVYLELRRRKIPNSPYDLPFPLLFDQQFIALNYTILTKPFPKGFRPKFPDIDTYVDSFVRKFPRPSSSMPPPRIDSAPAANLNLPKCDPGQNIRVIDSLNPMFHYLTEDMFYERAGANIQATFKGSPPPFPELSHPGYRSRLKLLVSAEDHPYAKSSVPHWHPSRSFRAASQPPPSTPALPPPTSPERRRTTSAPPSFANALHPQFTARHVVPAQTQPATTTRQTRGKRSRRTKAKAKPVAHPASTSQALFPSIVMTYETQRQRMDANTAAIRRGQPPPFPQMLDDAYRAGLQLVFRVDETELQTTQRTIAPKGKPELGLRMKKVAQRKKTGPR